MLNQQQKSYWTVRSSAKTSEEAEKKRKQETAEEMLYQDLILNSRCLSDAQITSLSWKDSESISTNINGLYSSAVMSRLRYAEIEPKTTVKCTSNNPACPWRHYLPTAGHTSPGNGRLKSNRERKHYDSNHIPWYLRLYDCGLFMVGKWDEHKLFTLLYWDESALLSVLKRNIKGTWRLVLLSLL